LKRLRIWLVFPTNILQKSTATAICPKLAAQRQPENLNAVEMLKVVRHYTGRGCLKATVVIDVP
jgi:hypothetical protein